MTGILAVDDKQSKLKEIIFTNFPKLSWCIFFVSWHSFIGIAQLYSLAHHVHAKTMHASVNCTQPNFMQYFKSLTVSWSKSRLHWLSSPGVQNSHSKWLKPSPMSSSSSVLTSNSFSTSSSCFPGSRTTLVAHVTWGWSWIKMCIRWDFNHSSSDALSENQLVTVGHFTISRGNESRV